MNLLIFLALASSEPSQLQSLDFRVKALEDRVGELEKKVAACPCVNSQLLPAKTPTAAISGTQQQFVQVCENGVCRTVPVVGATQQTVFSNGGCYTDPVSGQMVCDSGGGGGRGGFFRGVGRVFFGRGK